MTIFGLGNPGLKYRSARHNTGFIFLDKMVRRYKRRFSKTRGYNVAKIEIGNRTIKLIKPICWMNESGVAIKEILAKTNEDFLVVIDDINMNLGKVRLREKGGDGGHLGLRSIIKELKNSDFPRLRIGVGPPGKDVVAYVLNAFPRAEKKFLAGVISKTIEGIELLATRGFEPAQNFINSINSREIN